MSEGDTPEEKGKEFLNDPAVDRITDELVEALKATIKAHGLKGLKSLSIVAIAGDAAGGGCQRRPDLGLRLHKLPDRDRPDAGRSAWRPRHGSRHPGAGAGRSAEGPLT